MSKYVPIVWIILPQICRYSLLCRNCLANVEKMFFKAIFWKNQHCRSRIGNKMISFIVDDVGCFKW
jgi:hypothetical protein